MFPFDDVIMGANSPRLSVRELFIASDRTYQQADYINDIDIHAALLFDCP